MKIDLHGLIEEEAILEIYGALSTLDFDDSVESVEIITGKGKVLTFVLEEILENEGYSWTHENNNYGSYIINKK